MEQEASNVSFLSLLHLLALVVAVVWPLTLTIALALVAWGATVFQRWGRWVCFGAAALLAADCLLTFRLWPP